MKKVLVAMSLVAMFLFGCSRSNEDEVRKAKRFEALKGLPLDTVLTRAYKFYEQFQACLRILFVERFRRMIPWRWNYAKSIKL